MAIIIKDKYKEKYKKQMVNDIVKMLKTVYKNKKDRFELLRDVREFITEVEKKIK
jgi:hypothetical protein